ncbi:hypothetical protein S40293_10321 [Stachybotrys chartarum IBT 40293]|nr:hypothetical protein S40293_10321 [Stachybotrys chartarum IBT 40293]
MPIGIPRRLGRGIGS